jgi:hypothetical protein
MTECPEMQAKVAVMSDSPSDRAEHQLGYAPAPRRRNHFSLVVALILPVPFFYLWALEFAEEPPGSNGYILEPESRRVVAVLIACLAVVWIGTLAYLLKRWFRRASTP